MMSRLLSPSMLCRLTLIVFCSTSVSVGQSREEAEGKERLISAEAREIASSIQRRTNRFRKRQGLGELKRNDDLQQAAMDFAAYMARTEKYGHEADGSTPAERARAAGYRYCRVSENIAYQYRSRDLLDQELAKLFVQGWKRSPGHRENLLDSQVTEAGIGVAFGESLTTAYAVQLFGRPQSKQVQIIVKNRAGEEVTVEFFARGESRLIDMPSRSRLEVTRCYPTTVRLVARGTGNEADGRDSGGRSDRGVSLEESATLIVRRDREGELGLERR